MIEQANVEVPFRFAVTDDDGEGVTGLDLETNTVTVYDEAGNADAGLDDGDGLVEIGDGLYEIPYTPDAEGEWTAVFKTADYGWYYAQWVVGRAGVENLDAPISTVDTVVDGIATNLTALIATIGVSAAGVASAVWGAATRTLTAFSFTPSLHGDYDAAKTAATQASVDAAQVVVDAIQERTDNLPDDPADQSLIIAATDAIIAAIGALENLSAAQVNAEVDAALGDADVATATALAAAKAVLDAVKAVTDLLPDSGALTTLSADAARLTAARAQVLTDWIDAGRLDALLDTVKAKTDQLVFSKANELDSNIKSVNDVTVTGAGTEADRWEP